jgi:PDZ domain
MDHWHFDGAWNGQICKGNRGWQSAAPGYIHIEFSRASETINDPIAFGQARGQQNEVAVADFSVYDASGRRLGGGKVSTGIGVDIRNSTWEFRAGNEVTAREAGLPTTQELRFQSNDGVHIQGGSALTRSRTWGSWDGYGQVEFTGVHDNQSLASYRAQHPSPCGAPVAGRVTAPAATPMQRHPAAPRARPTSQQAPPPADVNSVSATVPSSATQNRAAIYQNAMEYIKKATWNGRSVVAQPGTYAAMQAVVDADPNGPEAAEMLEVRGSLDFTNDPSAGGKPTESKLGITVRPLSSDVADRLGTQPGKGVTVQDVKPNSFAEDIGLGRGDVILEVNRQPVNSEEDFRKIQAHLKSGQDAVFLVRRGRGRNAGTTFLAGTLP